jgi:hypothetical protein
VTPPEIKSIENGKGGWPKPSALSAFGGWGNLFGF